jgi:hypothetical protein
MLAMTQMSDCQTRYTIFVMNVYPNVCIGIDICSFAMLGNNLACLNRCKVLHVF